MSVNNQGCMPLGIISLISSYSRGPLSEGDSKRQSESSSSSSSTSSSVSTIAVPKILQMETVFQEMRLLQGFELAEWRTDVALKPLINDLFKQFKELILELGPYPINELINGSQYGEMIHYVGRLNPDAVNDYADVKPINLACKTPNLPALDALLRLEMDPIKRGTMATELLKNVAFRCPDTLKVCEELLTLLTSHGGDLDKSGLLEKASDMDHFSLIEICLKMGANPNLGTTLDNLMKNWKFFRETHVEWSRAEVRWVPTAEIPKGYQKCAELLLRHNADIYSIKSFPSNRLEDCYNFLKFAMDLKKNEQLKILFFAVESPNCLKTEEIIKLVMHCPTIDCRVRGGSRNLLLEDYLPTKDRWSSNRTDAEDVRSAILRRMELSATERWQTTLDTASAPLI